MTGYIIFRHQPWSGWRTLSALLRVPSAAAGLIASSVGVVLMLIPGGAAWPIADIADAIGPAAILDWVKGSLGLIFLLRRRFGTTHGG